MPSVADRPSWLHLAALFGLSAATLAFEILLLRLFEFRHWPCFAGFAIALALLALGAAGTTLALLGVGPQRWGDGWFLGGLLTAALGLYLVLGLHAYVALRPIFAAWDARELGKLLLVDIVAFVPFYGAGLAIGQVFIRWPRHARKLYAVNLLGSGVGSVAASVLLAFGSIAAALALIALLLLLVGAGVALAQRQRLAAGLCVTTLLLTAPLNWRPPAPALSDCKALARVQDLSHAQVLAVQAGLIGQLTLLRSESLRYAPGLSLAWPQAVPVMDVAIIGADAEVRLPRAFPFDAQHAPASLAGVPFALRPHGTALVLGASAWQSPALAGAGNTITWIEPDQRVLDIARQRGAGSPRFTLISDQPYRHLAITPGRYDLIVADQAYNGGDAATEEYVFTVEGIALALQRLAPDGLLAIPLRLELPPRHLTRMLATIKEGLVRHGAAAPRAHVAALRGLQTHLLLVSPAPLTQADSMALRAFAQQWQFDFDWLPDVSGEEVNRYHKLEAPIFFATARAILTGEVALPDDASWFATDSARLDRPYLWRSLLWQRAPHLLATMGPRAMAYLDWSLIFSVATVALVMVLALLLILAPLGRIPAILPPLSRISVADYYTMLGLGYLLIEIAVLQRVILFTGTPVLAASIVFAIFLIGSGVGSAMAPEARTRRVVLHMFAVIAVGLVIAAEGLWFTQTHTCYV